MKKENAPNPKEWLESFKNRPGILSGTDLEEAWQAVFWYCFDLNNSEFLHEQDKEQQELKRF